jgi:hypothetical protein
MMMRNPATLVFLMRILFPASSGRRLGNVD